MLWPQAHSFISGCRGVAGCAIGRTREESPGAAGAGGRFRPGAQPVPPPDRQESPRRPAGRETEVCMCECVCVHVCVCTQSEIQSQEASARLAVYVEGSHPPRVGYCPPCPCRTRASRTSSWFQSRTQDGAGRKRPCSVGEVSPSPPVQCSAPSLSFRSFLFG